MQTRDDVTTPFCLSVCRKKTQQKQIDLFRMGVFSTLNVNDLVKTCDLVVQFLLPVKESLQQNFASNEIKWEKRDVVGRKLILICTVAPQICQSTETKKKHFKLIFFQCKFKRLSRTQISSSQFTLPIQFLLVRCVLTLHRNNLFTCH